MLLEDVADRCIRDVVTDGGQRPLNPDEFPRRVLFGETNDKVDDHFLLLLIHPTGENHQVELPRMKYEGYGREVSQTFTIAMRP